METITDLYLFLLSVIFISLSGIMMPGPVFAVTVAKGYKNKIAGILIALGHGLVEFPLMFLIYFGFTSFFASSTVQKVISFVGGLILIYIGVQTFRIQRKTCEEYEDSGIAPLLLVFSQPVLTPTSFYGGRQSAPL